MDELLNGFEDNNDTSERHHIPVVRTSNSSKNSSSVLNGPIKINSHRKNYYQVSIRQRNRLKTLVRKVFSKSSEFLHSMGLCLSEVIINSNQVFNDPNFKLSIGPTINEFYPPVESKSSLYSLLYIKDKHSISDRAYSDLKTKCALDIPSVFLLRKRRLQIDKMFEIYNNQMGVFVSMEQKLRARLDSFFTKKYNTNSEFGDNVAFNDDIIHVKLGADGTNIGRNLKLLNFTFTIMNEGSKSKTATGNYTLGIYEIECENHASLTECFRELIDEIQQLDEITIGNKTMRIVYYLAADWKMLSIALGILGANSKHPCIWCKCGKDQFADLDIEWSILDVDKGARTHEEMASFVNDSAPKKKATTMRYGYEKQPIFKDIIPITRYMIDMLHLFLRISDTLFNLLVKDCSLLDNFDMSAISRFDVSSYKHMNSLQHFLNEKCSVRFTFLWTAETKKLTWRDLVGTEKVRLFESFNLAEVIPDHPKFEAVSKIWTSFYSILQEVKHVCIEPDELKQSTAEWLKLYLTVYNKSTVTPYMHAFVAHLHEFVYLYKDINAFNCQGLEKLNDISTSQYFKSTNKQDTALHQMLKKRNRMEYLNSSIFNNQY